MRTLPGKRGRVGRPERIVSLAGLWIALWVGPLQAEKVDPSPFDHPHPAMHSAQEPLRSSSRIRPTSIDRDPLPPPRAKAQRQQARWSLTDGKNALVLRGLLGAGLVGCWWVWFRSYQRRAENNLTDGIVQVYGKVPLDQKQQLHFVRIGRRLLVLVQGPQGVQHVTEIEDPEEVERILGHWNRPAGSRRLRHSDAEIAAHAARYATPWTDVPEELSRPQNSAAASRSRDDNYLASFRSS